MARRGRATRGGEDREETIALLLVPVWIGLFLGVWWAIDRLLALAPGAARAYPALARGARALAESRQVVAPILGLLLGSWAIVLLGELRRRLRGEPSPCQRDPEPAERPARGVPRSARDASAMAQVEQELDRVVRAERSGLKRAALSVNNRLMLSALRRRGYNDDIGCAGIVVLLLAATAALPFAAEALGRALEIEVAGQLVAFLWFALVFAAFAVRGVWKRSREARAADRPAP